MYKIFLNHWEGIMWVCLRGPVEQTNWGATNRKPDSFIAGDNST
jgi:hypothetical protein